MVFESIVTELLNKTLGEYVENLDSGQLKVSLWGGNNFMSFENIVCDYILRAVKYTSRVLLIDSLRLRVFALYC